MAYKFILYSNDIEKEKGNWNESIIWECLDCIAGTRARALHVTKPVKHNGTLASLVEFVGDEERRGIKARRRVLCVQTGKKRVCAREGEEYGVMG